MHVLNEVQGVYIDASEPLEHDVVALHYLIVVEVLGGDLRQLRSALKSLHLVNAAVDRIEQSLCEVCACAEELHLLAGLGCGYAAADGVVIAPYRTHYIIVLVLDGGGLYGNLGRILAEALREPLGVKNGQVRLRSGSHVLQGVEEAEVVLGDHVASVSAEACHLEGSPYRVAGEQLVVGRNTGELDHAELHYEVIDELLCLLLGELALVEVTLDVDIEEGGHTAYGHCSAVLGLDGGEVAEVQPLNCFLCVVRRSADVVAVGLGHLLHSLEGADLVGELLTLADDVIGHYAAAAVVEVSHLVLYEVVNTVEGNTAVVADDTSAAVGIRQAGEDLALACHSHLRGVRIVDALVVSLVILSKNLVELGVRGIAVGGACLLSHLDSAERHERTLQGLVGLEAYNLLLVLKALIDVAGAIRSDG